MGEQNNTFIGLYYLRAKYMNPETGTFISMDIYVGTLDNLVSLHKYLYANTNPVMNTDSSGYFSLAEMSMVQSIQSTINTVIVPYFNVKKIMSWANLAVTMYDVAQQVRLIFAGEANIFGLALAIAKGMITQALLNCALTA
ncbi:RHS repeat-associated core domain-containing protein, partial [Thomasclavelia cocleata]|uniref:RHS repeat-associated core domain-containing protein n=1 Tax=Thomasclavelia cocleata TaxID=69824 RepID=UPI0025AB8BE1